MICKTISFPYFFIFLTKKPAKQNKEVRILKIVLSGASRKVVKVVMRPERNLLMDFVVREQDNFLARKHFGGRGNC